MDIGQTTDRRRGDKNNTDIHIAVFCRQPHGHRAKKIDNPDIQSLKFFPIESNMMKAYHEALVRQLLRLHARFG